MGKDDMVFVKITNKDIYSSIQELKGSIIEFKQENQKGHEKIIKHQIKTNGKVKTNRWIATTALSVAILLIGWTLQFLK